LGQLFHPDFVEYLNNGYSSSEVSAMQQESHTRIYELQEKQSDLLEKKRSFD
jgi:hypothetical protein